jgi:hypothetical protein
MLKKHNVKIAPVSPGQTQIYWSYDEYWAMRWGGLQIAVGILSFLIGIPSIVNEIWKSGFGMGVWCGAIFICAGSLGIVSARSKSRIQIIACMSLSVLSVACAAGMLIVHVVALQRDNMKFKAAKANAYKTNDLETAVGLESRVVVDALLIICALIELPPSIGASVKAGDAFGCSQNLPEQEEWVKATAMRYIRKIKQDKTPNLVLIPVFMPTPNQQGDSKGKGNEGTGYSGRIEGKTAGLPPEAVQFGLPIYLGPPQYIQAAQLAFSADSDPEHMDDCQLSSFDQHMAPETPPPMPAHQHVEDADADNASKCSTLQNMHRKMSLEAQKFAVLNERRLSQADDIDETTTTDGKAIEHANRVGVHVMPTDDLKGNKKGRGHGFDNGAFQFNELEEKLRMPKT